MCSDQMQQPEDSAAAAPARSASADGGGGEAALRLEQRTHLDEGKYRIVLRNYGQGWGEIGWSFVSAIAPTKAGKGLSDNREDHEDRAVRRARSRIRQLILTVRADHLLTLTYRDNVTDFKRACSDLNKFVRIVKDQLPGWVYIAVPEQQKRGAWHWHMAVCGRAGRQSAARRLASCRRRREHRCRATQRRRG